MQQRDPYNVGPDGVAVWKYLDISTAHLPMNLRSSLTEENLEDIRWRGPVLHAYRYGWVMPVCREQDAEHTEEARYATPFRDIIAFARKHECSMVRIDADGVVTPGLPVYEE